MILMKYTHIIFKLYDEFLNNYVLSILAFQNLLLLVTR